MNIKQNRKRRQLGFEALEAREMMTTNILLDFGTAFETPDRTLPVSQSEYPAGDEFGMPPIEKVSNLKSMEDSLVSKGIDYNGDGVAGDAADVEALSQDVLQLVQRVYEPFNVKVHIANAANWDDVADTLAAHDTNDVYVVVAGSGPAGFGWAGEFLDDGNLNDGDGCNSQCQLSDAF